MNNLQELLTKLNNIENIKSDIMNAIASYNYPIDNNFNNYANAVSNLTADATATADMIYGENNTAYVNKVKVSGTLQDCSNLTNAQAWNKINIFNNISNIDVSNFSNAKNQLVLNKNTVSPSLDYGGKPTPNYIGLGFNSSTFINITGLGETENKVYFYPKPKYIVGEINLSNITNLANCFEHQSYLAVNSINAYNCVNASGMFSYDINLRYLGNLDMSSGRLENASYMFNSCRSIGVRPPDINWKINGTNLINASSMFNDAFDIDGSVFKKANFDLTSPRLNDVSHMFFGCGITSLPYYNIFNFQGDVNMMSMFEGAKNISLINIRLNDLTNLYVENICKDCTSLSNAKISIAYSRDYDLQGSMTGMFSGCSKMQTPSFLTQAPFGVNYLNVSNIKGICYRCSSMTITPNLSGIYGNLDDMSEMLYECNGIPGNLYFNRIGTNLGCNGASAFCKCSKITNIYMNNATLSNFINTSNMFAECQNLEKIVFSDADLVAATNMYQMFFNCYNLTTLPISNIDISSESDTTGMFRHCKSLTTVNIRYANGTKCTSMFRNCVNLATVNIDNLYPEGYIETAYMFEGCTNLVNIDVSNKNEVVYFGGNCANTFFKCYNLAELPFNIDTSNCTDVDYLFRDCYNLNIPVMSLDISNSTSVSGVFSHCSKLRSANIMFNSNEFIYASSTFNNCTNLTSLALSDIKVYSIGGFCNHCTNLTSFPTINLYAKKPSNNTLYLSSMFNGCTNLVDIDCSNWILENVSSAYDMFAQCSNLSDASIDSIINMLLNVVGTFPSSEKNLSSSASHGIFHSTGIANTRYQNRWDELTAAGWTY